MWLSVIASNPVIANAPRSQLTKSGVAVEKLTLPKFAEISSRYVAL
jgi:hypothetical protein